MVTLAITHVFIPDKEKREQHENAKINYFFMV